jgi:hypothetical protein
MHLGSLGSVNQAYNQALLTADQQQAQTGAYEPYGRLNQYGNMLTGLSGGVAGQQYQDQTTIRSLRICIKLVLQVLQDYLVKSTVKDNEDFK